MGARLALPQKLRSLGIIGRGRWRSRVENFTSIAMSALPPKADMDQHGRDVPIGRDVGQADDCFISLRRPLD